MKTIAAIATAAGSAGIGVVRVSGGDAALIASRVFFPAGGNKQLSEMQGYTAAYGICRDAGGEKIDEAVALVFRAPHSYTGEDVAEISCHGGRLILRKLLAALIQAGAAAAEPGEFSKRAFLNGKLRLTEAEAVMELIGAQSEQALRVARSEKDGALYRRIKKTLSEITGMTAQILAYVDYPDDEIEELSTAQAEKRLRALYGELKSLLEDYDQARILREGVHTVIVGRPNVGKSALMNFLAGTDRSIVTEIAGTTRDVVEESVSLGGILLRLSDTAGLREGGDPIERIGVRKTGELLETAELIIAVFDGSQPLSSEDFALIGRIKGKTAVAVISKSDLPEVLDEKSLPPELCRAVRISSLKGIGMRELAAAVEKAVGAAGIDMSAGILLSERQRGCVRRAKAAIAEALDSIEQGFTPDVYCVHLDAAAACLLELSGERVSDRVVEEIFSRFCVGK
ncbi:MAG TPA: tRNA uridine-5-carboxymethylaminomethyl(34) synthesis GTPase MnmE [Ruminococcaceae bacterium]|nr:tRNA uridine-5-carboxymethylaminomethyl(34) synthesis GTPase MnmE [Oscillospiraceae bacterium]